MRRALVFLLVTVATAVALAQPRPRARLIVGEGLNEPFAVDFDRAGRMFIAEMGGNRVSVFDPPRGLLPLPTPFHGPHHLITGSDGLIYVADTWAHVVRRVDPATGVVTPLAGTGEKGFGGDGGQALDARFGSVFAIAMHNGILYVADLDNRRIRSVHLATGMVATVAGNGATGVPVDGADARGQPLVDPRAVAVDNTGQIYICERGGHALRVVDTAGRIRTVAGTGVAGFSGDGGPALKAALRGPKHISIDTDGSVLITDTENHMIRRFRPATGTIERVAGTGEAGAAGLDGPPEHLQLNRPHGAFRYNGALYISDSENHRVVAID